jgi:hypothetical protein
LRGPEIGKNPYIAKEVKFKILARIVPKNPIDKYSGYCKQTALHYQMPPVVYRRKFFIVNGCK